MRPDPQVYRAKRGRPRRRSILLSMRTPLTRGALLALDIATGQRDVKRATPSVRAATSHEPAHATPADDVMERAGVPLPAGRDTGLAARVLKPEQSPLATRLAALRPRPTSDA